jgi:hypothetical protein
MVRARFRWLALAAFVMGGCLRGGFVPKADTGAAAPFDRGAAPFDREAAPFDQTLADDLPQAAPDAAVFNAAGNGCLEANDGPFVELARFDPPNTAYGVWYAAPYVLSASTVAGVYALSFDGTAFTERDHQQDIGWAEAVWSLGGSTVYVGSPGSGLRAFRLEQTGKLTFLAEASSAVKEARRLWGDEQYLYVPCGDGGLHTLSFDGASFSPAAAPVPTQGWSHATWTDGKMVYLADGGSVRAFSLDGTLLSEVASESCSGANRLWGHGNMLYVGGEAGVTAFSIGSDKLQSIALAPTDGKVRDVWSDGAHVFAAASQAGLYAFRFDGSAFVKLDQVDTDGNSLGVVGDGTYIYLGDTNEVIAYAGFACRRTAN